MSSILATFVLWFEKKTKNKEQIYIIPTKSGMKFLFINFLLFLIALSFANNMALIVSFIMISFFIIQMLETHKIIQEIRFESLQIKDQYAHKASSVYCYFLPPHLLLRYIQLELPCKQKKISTKFKISPDNKQNIYQFSDLPRGKYDLERIKLFTTGHTSLFYVWTYKSCEEKFYIYPRIKEKEQKLLASKIEDTFSGELEFKAHKKYFEGQDAQRIDWNLFAKIDQLYKKEYIFEDEKTIELNYNKLNGDKEQKLMVLSYLIKIVFQEKKSWRLVLPSIVLEEAQGRGHFKKSMEAISVF